jgi:23S rRNA (uracil1939-C5)-methyltransferase
MKKNKTQEILENVFISDAGSEGKCVTRIDDMVIFVEGAIPGDTADLQVLKKKKSFMETKAIRIIKPSALRSEPFCSHFGVCGGCKWQNLNYASQLEYKQKQVVDALERLGHIKLPEVTPIKASAKTDHYRNKLEYTFSNKRWLTVDDMKNGLQEELGAHPALGFHIPRRFDKILDIDTCYLQAEPSNSIRLAVKDYAVKNNLSFFDLKEQHGLLRNLIIRSSSNGQLMVIVAFHAGEESDREGLLNFLSTTFPQITSLMYVINIKRNDTISDLEIKTFKGNDHIVEEMEGLQFKIGPKSFYQTNSEQAYELYKITRNFAAIKPNEIVYDLYTGTGTIANFVAHQAEKVIGIEYVPSAIDDAHINSEINKITNTSFYAGDMKDVLNDDFIAENGKPDVIITDPPRAGMHEDVVKKILEIAPERVVYVSCNPATQARDLALMDVDYKVTKVQPVDMFPHTHHVENVVLLEKR